MKEDTIIIIAGVGALLWYFSKQINNNTTAVGAAGYILNQQGQGGGYTNANYTQSQSPSPSPTGYQPQIN